jgi:hypothetical protein
MLADGNVTGAAAKAADAMTAARSLSFPFPMALCLETAALVVQHADTEAAGRLLAAASVIRERGNRPCPVPMSAAIARARLAAPPSPGPALDPAETAGEAAALLASLAASGQMST